MVAIDRLCNIRDFIRCSRLFFFSTLLPQLDDALCESLKVTEVIEPLAHSRGASAFQQA